MTKKVMGSIIVLVIALGTFFACNGKNMKEKQAILVVSFGTSVEETRVKTIDACEKKIAETFKNYQIERAFTSNIIRKIYKERGVDINSVEEALNKLKEAKYETVIVQPLHVIPGEEYSEKVVEVVNTYKNDGSFKKITVGTPLLSTVEDYDKVIEALKPEIAKLDKTDSIVFMGHGTHHFANSSYSCMQLKINDQKLPYIVGTVEGYPALEQVETKLKERGSKSLTLVPLMVVAGDHAQNDMAGAEDDSWKSILEKDGYTVKASLRGMGEYEGIQAIYLEHIAEAIKGLN